MASLAIFALTPPAGFALEAAGFALEAAGFALEAAGFALGAAGFAFNLGRPAGVFLA